MASNIIVLNQAQVLNNLQSEAEFPVDFEMAWQWAGYARKDSALRKLNKHFDNGFDFSTDRCNENQGRLNGNQGGSVSVAYFLTNDCFKEFCMMAGTEKGKEVRRYYLDCEKQLKAIAPAPAPAPVQIGPSLEERLSMLTSSLERLGLTDSPRHMQLAKDHVANLLGEQRLALPEARMLGVVEIAEELGFPAYPVSRVRSTLGKVVAAWYRAETNSEPQTELRIVNGREVPLKIYCRTNELDILICSTLSSLGLKAS